MMSRAGKNGVGDRVVRARIIGTGSYVPERVLTNQDLEKMVETSAEWIEERTGIRERRIAAEKEASSDLATEAAQRALRAAGILATDLDLIVVATTTPDMFIPSTACLLQERIGAKRVSAFDLAAACSGFLFALSVGDQFVRSGSCRYVLVVGSEVMSRIMDWTDRSTCVLFGDGAGAVVLEATDEERGILSCHLHSDGALWDLLHVPGGGSRCPPSQEGLHKRSYFMRMKGNELFRVAVRMLEDVAEEALSANGLKVPDIDLLIPHQANARIIMAVAERLGISSEKIVLNLDRFGNTSAASIPLALDEAVEKKRVDEGDVLLFLAFGGGLTWGSAMVRW